MYERTEEIPGIRPYLRCARACLSLYAPSSKACLMRKNLVTPYSRTVPLWIYIYIHCELKRYSRRRWKQA